MRFQGAGQIFQGVVSKCDLGKYQISGCVRSMRFATERITQEYQEEAASLDTVQVGSWIAYAEGSEVHLLRIEEIEGDQWYQGKF